MLPTGILPGARAGPLRPRSAAPTPQALPVRPGARTRARRAGPLWPLSSIEELEAPPGTSARGRATERSPSQRRSRSGLK